MANGGIGYPQRIGMTPHTDNLHIEASATGVVAHAGVDAPRVLGEIHGPADGPCLICVAGIHGNEPSGVHALQRVFARLEQDPTGLTGHFAGFAGNRQALRKGVRYVHEDMNRAWQPDRLVALRMRDADNLVAEEREMLELDHEVEQRLRPGACVIDLHSTSGPGRPFVTMDDTLRNRAFTEPLPVPRVLGLEEELAGTFTGHLIAHRRMPAVGFESGSHYAPSSVEHAEAAIWICLEASGVLEQGVREEPVLSRRLLIEQSGGLAAVVEVRHRHAVDPNGFFEMKPGYKSFQAIRRGEPLADELGMPVLSPFNALMLMPRYQGQGDDGFFLVRPVNTLWLSASSLLRRLRASRWVHYLPGVRKAPDRPGSFLVDRTRARWLVPQIFHLLGFRKEPATGDMTIMTPRDGSRIA